MPVIGDKPQVTNSRDPGDAGEVRSPTGPDGDGDKPIDDDGRSRPADPDLPPGPVEKSGAMKAGGVPTGGNAAALRTTLEDKIPPAQRGPEAPPKPEVTRVLAHYGVDARLGRPRERIAGWVARVHDDLMASGAADKSPADFAENLLADDVRLQVFYLEGILKLYRKRYGDDAEDVYDKVKALEDHLGDASGARAQLALAEGHPDVPKAAVDWLREQVEKNDAALVKLLREDWTPDDVSPDGEGGRFGALKDVVAFLESTDWDDYKDDKTYVVGELNRRIKKNQKEDYDMSELQGDTGVHELRRDLRWFPIYAVALDGMIQFSEARNPILEYQPLLQADDLVGSKYAQLPEGGREKDPVEFSRSLYLRNTQLIDELGALKDTGEEIEAIAFAFEGADLIDDPDEAKERATEALGLPRGTTKGIHARAQAIYDELQDHDYFKVMRDEVRGR